MSHSNFQHEGFVLQDWLADLPFMQQAVLLSAIRGCDGAPKDDVSKKVTRCVRAAVLKSARPNDPKRKFLGERDGPRTYPLVQLIDDHDHYPHHFLHHLLHAIVILAYKHPNPGEQSFWRDTYLSFCEELHCNPETEEQLDERLSDRP